MYILFGSGHFGNVRLGAARLSARGCRKINSEVPSVIIPSRRKSEANIKVYVLW